MRAVERSAPGPDVVEALVDGHRQFLAFLERRLGDRQEAEEVLQAAFVRALERAGEIRDQDRAVPWFYRLLHNALVDHWRRRASEKRGLERLAREESVRASLAPEAEAELCRCFEALLPALRPDQADLLRRVDLEGARPVELAAELGITANNLMVRLHRARRALREQLVASCRTCAEHGCLDCSCGSTPVGST